MPETFYGPEGQEPLLTPSPSPLHERLLPELLPVLDSVLGLQGRAARFHPDTPLLGAVPELDSMAVIALIAALEEQFGVAIDDEDLQAATFATVGSLCHMLRRKMVA